MLKLKENVKTFKKILDTLPNSVYVKDLEGRYIWLNKVSLDQLESKHLILDSIIGKTDFEIFPEADAKGYVENDEEVIKTKKGIVKEEVVTVPDGRELTRLSFKEPLFDDESAEIIGLLGYTLDITDRKKAERAKSEFIANMSHDIRTPITGMVGMIQDLLNTVQETKASLKNNEFTSAQQLSRHLENLSNHVENDSNILMESVDQLLQLCNEILELTRLENGILNQPTESFDIHDLIQGKIELLQPVAKNKNLTLSAEIDKHVPKYVKGLKSYTDRTVLNIVSNALKFTNKGHVKVTLSVNGKKPRRCQVGDAINLQITIKDTGIGIPEDKFETIFEHFSRLTPSFEGIYKGYGLGLYTVKRYLEAMKGTINVESKIGKGTCFKIIFPVTVSDKKEYPRQSIRTAKPTLSIAPLEALSFSFNKPEVSESSSNHVLIAEDSKVAAMALTVTLKPFKCAIDWAETGAIAIEKAKNNTYDLIFMDIGLPDMTGIDVTKGIRAFSDAQKSNVPIVGVTGHANNPEMRQKCLDAGMQEILNKPAQSLALENIFKTFIFKKQTSLESSPHTSNSLDNEKGKIIDWEGCLHMCHGQKELLDQILPMISNDLDDTLSALETLYPARDLKGLRDQLHKVLGGISYVHLPQLEHALKAFQGALKTEPSDFEEWERTYKLVKKAVRAFQKELKNH